MPRKKERQGFGSESCCPLDLAFLIVALVVIVAGLVALRSGVRSLKPSRLVPAKSISQISLLLGGEPWA
jgi:hypothetical protein